MNWYEIYNIMDDEDNRLPNRFFAEEEHLFGHDWLNDFSVGARIDDWNPSSLLRATNPQCDGVPDDIMANAFQLPVFSQRLRNALSQFGIGTADIQYLPIQVARSTGEELPGFAVANVITRIPALVPEHTKMYRIDENEIDPLTGKPKVTSAWKTALKAELLPGHDVIRLLEYFPPILASERFVKVFNKNGFTGANFTRVPVI